MPQLDLTCVQCGYQCDRAENLEDPQSIPQPGDITICINCGQAYLLGANWTPMTDTEIKRLDPTARDQLEAYQRARRVVITENLALKQKFKP